MFMACLIKKTMQIVNFLLNVLLLKLFDHIIAFRDPFTPKYRFRYRSPLCQHNNVFFCQNITTWLKINWTFFLPESLFYK